MRGDCVTFGSHMQWTWTLFLLSCGQSFATDPPPLRTAWSDEFGRAELGPAYRVTGAGYEIRDAALSAKGARNHPLWLRRRIPRNVRIEFDCWSNDPRGDIKVELFGDGRSFDPDGGRYAASGYELIFGGWANTKSIIARMDEHGADIAQRVLPKVVSRRRYHWKIERTDRTVAWWIDDLTAPFLTYEDADPLSGSGHEYFGFNNWETDTWFDNLVVTPL